ncbi:MAG: 50S ribosomal protein L24 [Candidatus Methylarchaceae archaeon HK02M1]|nr:50S ribosomal protein L24 [Candidatus Methylarchaceae archaeon HK01M]MCP8312529.1 50S ribosomal protein L24 [Candidatus Methylarchaceae archaeon HK02M1]
MSSKPSKVRKKLFTSPPHIRSKQISSHLSEGLRSKYNVRSSRVKKDDVVKVVRGEYKGIEGKVTEVDAKTGRIMVEGITREKIAGGTTPVKIHPSKVIIMELKLDDKWRKEKLEARKEEA